MHNVQVLINIVLLITIPIIKLFHIEEYFYGKRRFKKIIIKSKSQDNSMLQGIKLNALLTKKQSNAHLRKSGNHFVKNDIHIDVVIKHCVKYKISKIEIVTSIGY